MADSPERIVQTLCASHCGGACVLKLHVKDGMVTRLETDDGPEPQLRACVRGRAYRQRVYDPERILYPLKRTGERGAGQFERISWDEAIDTIARQLVRIRDAYGPGSILYLTCGGDLANLHTPVWLGKVLALSGGFTATWGVNSFQSGIYASQITYGTHFAGNTRDDLVNARLIIMWGWNPTSTIGGSNSNFYLTKAKEAGTKIVAIDPRYTDTAAILAQQWIPIRPGTDGAMLAAMAHVIIAEHLHDQRYVDTYTVGFDRFRQYILGAEDGVAKTPEWAETITAVPAATIGALAREYATTKPAALIAGIAPGRTATGEQYHRLASTLAAITGNVGIHGGDAAGRSWEANFGGYPYRQMRGKAMPPAAPNPVDDQAPAPRRGSPFDYKAHRVHRADVPDFIERGRAGGFHADCRMIVVGSHSFVNAVPNVNRIVRALKSERLEFMFAQEQVMMPTAKYCDIVLPVNTFWERRDFATGVGLAYYGLQNKAVDPLGESKSPYEIASLLARRLGLAGFEQREEELVDAMIADSEIPDAGEFKRQGLYRIPLGEPHVAFQKHIEDPAHNPFPTPSGKIEIYSELLADLNLPGLAPIPKYVEAREGWNDPLRSRFPLQMISTHLKRRANTQFETLPWLRELEPQAVTINAGDAAARGIQHGDTVRIFNDRGEVVIPAQVTERIAPGVVDIPAGAWYAPDGKGVDRGGCANVLISHEPSPGGQLAFNTCLVQVERA